MHGSCWHVYSLIDGCGMKIVGMGIENLATWYGPDEVGKLI